MEKEYILMKTDLLLQLKYRKIRDSGMLLLDWFLSPSSPHLLITKLIINNAFILKNCFCLLRPMEVVIPFS